ncbi:MAG TPA: AbrB/MazE/SpoVT family DNA-binding domain-containing protein [Promineifilum sp.]|nr:AbrB/MazE/SpoVT family DNA-binding domain-containing protein [Promineifilum sp.]
MHFSKSLKKDNPVSQLVKITRGGQITLPASLRRAAGIDIGDYVEVSVTDEGIVLRAKEVIDKSQAYFWTNAWQQGEREAQADIDTGQTRSFDSIDELIADLDSEG